MVNIRTAMDSSVLCGTSQILCSMFTYVVFLVWIKMRSTCSMIIASPDFVHVTDETALANIGKYIARILDSKGHQTEIN